MQATIHAPGLEPYAEAARFWLTETRQRFESLLPDRPGAHFGVLQRSGVPALGSGNWTAQATPRSFAKMLESFDERGEAGGWMIGDEQAAADEALSAVRANVWSLSPAWMECSVTVTCIGDTIPAPVEEEMSELVLACADRTDVSFATTSTAGVGGQTELETALRRPLANGLAESGSCLRGYSWLTFAPELALARLGGVAALTHSGAFVDVRPVAGKGALLRATERFHEFDDQRSTGSSGRSPAPCPEESPRGRG